MLVCADCLVPLLLVCGTELLHLLPSLLIRVITEHRPHTHTASQHSNQQPHQSNRISSTAPHTRMCSSMCLCMYVCVLMWWGQVPGGCTTECDGPGEQVLSAAEAVAGEETAEGADTAAASGTAAAAAAAASTAAVGERWRWREWGRGGLRHGRKTEWALS